MREHQSKKFNKYLNPEKDSKMAQITIQEDFVISSSEIDFDTSRKDFSEMQCYEPSNDKELYDKIVNEWLQPNTNSAKKNIAIVGQAQVGKTQVLKTILKNLQEKKWRHSYMFVVSLDKMECSEKSNILQFLTEKTSALEWINFESKGPFQRNDVSHRIFKKVIAKLTSEKETICIIFNAFKKFEYSYKKYSSYGNFSKQEKIGNFMTRILKEGFGNSQLLLQLNPWDFLQLSNSTTLESELCGIVWVQGIDHNGQNILFQNEMLESKNIQHIKELSCKKNCRHKDKCIGTFVKDHESNTCTVCKSNYLKNCHYEIRSLCFVPCNCKIFFKTTNFEQLSSIVAVASVLIEKLTEVAPRYENEPEKNFFVKICRFAWDNYEKQQFCFSEGDLSDLNRTIKNICFSCTYSKDFSDSPSKLYFFFSHILLQEFLAAMWLLSLSPEDFEIILKANRFMFLEKEFTIVYKFMEEILFSKRLKRYHSTKYWKIPKEMCKIFEDFSKQYS